MSIFVIDPILTVGERPDAQLFVEHAVKELQQHIGITHLKTSIATAAAMVSSVDIIMFFNSPEDVVQPEVLSFLQRAHDAGAEFIPIAIDTSVRQPIGATKAIQSFDVIDELRLRHLDPSQLPTVASALARTIIARVQPTLCKEQMRLFISHRRLDGEGLAFAFWEEARNRVTTTSVFRDLGDLRAGIDNDNAIIDALAKSDAVIFLDTPKAGESGWIARELTVALARNLPIVWVRFGPVEGRVPLQVVPSKTPHFDFPNIDVARTNIDPQLVDQAIHTAFDLSRTSALRIFDSIGRLTTLVRSGTAHVNLLDQKKMVYEVKIPRTSSRYYQRPLTQLVQFFGRWPSDEDEAEFGRVAQSVGYEIHPKHGLLYDAGILIAPIPSGNPRLSSGGEQMIQVHVDSADDYLSDIEARVQQERSEQHKRGVIIAAAFPECDPEHEQHLKDATYTFVRAIYDRGGIVIFGGHPTIQPMVFQIARERLPDDRMHATHLYLSKFFVTSEQIEEHRREAVTIATDIVEGDRTKSLTKMREAMIHDNEALALIAIGGLEPSEGRLPGIDEEVELARNAGLPVFLIGSAGGRTATLGAELRAKGWKPSVNSLTTSENEELFLSYDYGVLANMVLDAIGL